MTRLANSDLPREEVAKYFGVARQTVQVYHRMSGQTPALAAAILAGHPKGEAVGVKSEPGSAVFCAPARTAVPEV